MTTKMMPAVVVKDGQLEWSALATLLAWRLAGRDKITIDRSDLDAMIVGGPYPALSIEVYMDRVEIQVRDEVHLNG